MLLREALRRRERCDPCAGPRVRRVLLIAFLAAAVAAPAAAQVELPPNLRPFPPVSPHLSLLSPSGVEIRFGTMAWNNGLGPVEIRGGAVNPGEETQQVWQRVYRSNGSYTDYLSGNFIYHPGHGHVHFEDYAIYTLEPLDVPVPTPPVSSKTSFCLLDTIKIDGSLEGAPKRAVYATCAAAVQGISVGWGDEYRAVLPGQSIDMTGFPAGIYRLSIEIDPFEQLIEIDDGDNFSSVRLLIDPARLFVQVLNCTSSGDLDCDGVANSVDLCPYFQTQVQSDTDGDGRGDACECTDQNGDGRNTVSDLLAINAAIFNSALVTPLCDGNDDGLCDVNDIVAANLEIFSPANTSTCARQPVPGP